MERAWWARTGGLALALALAVAVLPGSAGAAEPGNGCIRCHQEQPAGSRIAKRHQDFVGSVHQRAGVHCNDCHGGDPAAADKTQAHAGVLPASDPDSRIYYRTVPRTCGRCHPAELKAFSRSRHFAQLEATGKGPNCVTCHGSMATHVLKAADVEGFCTVCHNERLDILPDKPAQAEATLRLMDAVRTLLAWDRELTAAAEARKAPAKDAATALASGSAELEAAGRAWHTFDLPAIQAHLDRALTAAKAAKAALPAP